MKEERDEQADQCAWVEKTTRIVTFQETEGFEKLTFQSREDKISYVYHLCEIGYRVM